MAEVERGRTWKRGASPDALLPPLRAHPHLFQVNTWVWLHGLSQCASRELRIADVPDAEWDRLQHLGFDLVYLLGIWQRSAAGRRIARTDPCLFRIYDRALPGWSLDAVVGSPFSISAYVPDRRIGTWEELDAVRAKLNARGMRLVLDFVSNHTGPDHPWVSDHPQYFVRGSEADYRRDPAAFHYVERQGERLFIACGRDPYFPPWTDTAQLDHSNPETRNALLDTLRVIAGHCDGVRCDMAMLALTDIFRATWSTLLGDRETAPAAEFWPHAIAAVRAGFLWMAEVYWDMEARLLDLGFSYTYDKRLYDRLLGEPADHVRAHLGAPLEYQSRMARFIENHDEPRSVLAFGRHRIPALATMLATVPGLRFIHDGQMEGRSSHVPMQLGAAAEEPQDQDLRNIYERVLATANRAAFHDGEWRMIEPGRDNDDSWRNLVAYRWRLPSDYWLIVINLGDEASQGRLAIADELGECARYELTDVLDEAVYVRDRARLVAEGLYVRLPAHGAHLFRVRALTTT